MTYSTNTFTASRQQPSTADGSGANTSGTVNISEYSNTGTQPGSGATILREGSTYYDTIRSDLEQAQRMDVTDQIRRYANEIYGGSDSTQQSGLAASKSLQFSKAATMQRAQRLSVRAIPFTFQFVGQVGLFGAENAYVEIDLDIDKTLEDEYEEPGWNPAKLTFGDYPPIDTYMQADIQYDKDLYTINTYEPALITNAVPSLLDNPKVSIRLDDVGTGNIYIDTWLETMLYKRNKEMWGYDKMYVSPTERFFVGLHARNTRRLDYNVTVTIGEEFLPYSAITEKELVATTNY
tara:strand:- start:1021 stop:1899 length:879 start_codon:yes stop_codon:yes gene_type:complete